MSTLNNYVHCVVFGDGPTAYELPHVAKDRIEQVRARIRQRNRSAKLIELGPAKRLPPEKTPIAPVASRIRTESILPEPAPAAKSTKPAKPAYTGPARGRPAGKGVINTTTGEFFATTTLAAKSVNAHQATICQQIAGKCKQVRGNVFRYATQDEVAARKAL